MKKKKKILLTIISFIAFTSKTYAECTNEEVNAFKKISNEYKVTYEMNTESKLYNLTFYDPAPDKYTFVINGATDGDFSIHDNNNYQYLGLSPGEYTVTIEGVTNTCKDVLKTINLSLPKYNKYTEDPLCKGIEEFVLCQPTYDKDIDYETFKQRVEVYKKTKTENNIKTDDINKNNAIVNYFKNNIGQISLFTISLVLVIIVITLIAKRQKKSRRLE